MVVRWVKRSTLMILIGGILWLIFAAYTQALIRLFGVNHSVAEASAIPLSVVTYFLLVTRLVFHQTGTLRQFVSFASITAFGWLIFLGISASIVDILGLDSGVGLLAGIAVNSAINVAIQQAVTWDLMARNSRQDIA